MKLSDVLKKWEKVLPLSYQESWDHCGLNLGSRNQNIKRVLFAYDICHEVIRFAAKEKCQLIISHHPFRMSSEVNLDLDSYDGQTIALAIQNKTALYSCHTNHDSSLHSLNHHYLKKLGIQNSKPLQSSKENLFKLITYVPKPQAASVLNAMFNSGAGQLGDYSECSFRSDGIGTFKGNANSNPALGKKHEKANIKEERLEVLVTQEVLPQVITAMVTTHPYEEVAYEVISLENQREDIGLGAIGELTKALTKKELIHKLKKLFGTKIIRFVDGGQKRFKKIAICTGSGSSLLSRATQKQADVLITGDMKYHQAIEAKRHNISVADVGHFDSEKDSIKILKNLFAKSFGSQIETKTYTKLRDAFDFL